MWRPRRGSPDAVTTTRGRIARAALVDVDAHPPVGRGRRRRARNPYGPGSRAGASSSRTPGLWVRPRTHANRGTSPRPAKWFADYVCAALLSAQGPALLLEAGPKVAGRVVQQLLRGEELTFPVRSPVSAGRSTGMADDDTKREKAPKGLRPWLRGVELNHRPSGYEPDELPLLHRASVGRRTLLRVLRLSRQCDQPPRDGIDSSYDSSPHGRGVCILPPPK
jgi:hypothetical protein